MSDIPQTLQIRAGEVRAYDFDFTQQTEIQAGQTIASVTSLVWAAPGGGSLVAATNSALTGTIPPGSPLISGNKVQFWVGAVQAAVGAVFNFTCTVVTSGGATLVEEGVLQVIA